jgi:putative salt-induced outer membrane protein
MKLLIISFLIALAIKAHAEPIKNESEVGISSAKGNTSSETYIIKQINSYQFDENILRFTGRYLNAFAEDKESARYLSLSLRYEREISKTFSAYAAESLDKDPFAGYRSRIYSDVGGKYFLEQAKESTTYVEAGYRYLTEKRYTNTEASFNYARALVSFEKTPSESITLRWWLEYLPNVDESKEYFINSEVSLSVMLSSAFSLKSGYLLRYNNAPLPGVVYKTDKLLTTAIVAKF